MAVKKGILDNFLKPSSHYADNQKNLRSIFIDKTDDDLKPDPQNFLESSLLNTLSGTQLEHKRNTIGTQDVNDKTINNQVNTIEQKIETPELEHKRNTSGTQLEHIRNTKRTHQEHKKDTSGTQLEHAKEHTKEHNRNTIGTHQEHKGHKLTYLTGIQKKLLTFLYISCKSTRSHTTEEFSITNIASLLDIKIGSVKNSLRRLEDKKFLISVQFKKGRGGWTKFEIPDQVYRELLEKEHNWNTTGTQLEHKKDTERNTERNTNSSSSSSILYTTTTTELDDQWKFDISPYAEFGSTLSHLKQLFSLQIISASEVEQSLIEFNYDLKSNALPKIKTNKINFLMGLLRAGHSYTSETYRNEQEQMIKLMADRVAQKKKMQLEEKFIAWRDQLSEEDINKIIVNLPPNLMVLYRAHGMDNIELKKYFLDYFMNKCSTWNIDQKM